MKIFISWSGERSHRVAQAVCKWIRAEVPGAEPWLSSDMRKGVAWTTALLDALATSNVGVFCVTSEAEHDWLAFEAGALLADPASSTFVLLVDPDADLESSPLVQLTTLAADRTGLSALANHLGGREDSESLNELVRECEGVGSASVRDFELWLVLPEGSVRRRIGALRDAPWLPSIDGMFNAIRKELPGLGEHDFTSFHYLDIRAQAWLAPPKRLSSIETDQLALLHPRYFEDWRGNARLAAETLTRNAQFQDSVAAAEGRDRIAPVSAFLFGSYVLQLAAPNLSRSAVAALLAAIQELPDLPRRWKYEAATKFLANPDMNALTKALGAVAPRIERLVQAGFTFSSLTDAPPHVGRSTTIEFVRRLIRQFRAELLELEPPAEVTEAIFQQLDAMALQDSKESLSEASQPFRDSVVPFILWLKKQPLA